MGAIQLLRKVRKVRNELPSLIRETLLELGDFIIEANQRQLLKGLKTDGYELGEYLPITIENKEKKGTYIQPDLKIALKDYGDFFNSFKLEGNTLKLGALDVKTNKLLDIYGENIFGIPLSDKEEFTNYFVDTLFDKITVILKNG